MKTREVPQHIKLILPATAMYNAIRIQSAAREADRTEREKSLKDAKEALARIALAFYAFKKYGDNLPDHARNSFLALGRAFAEGGMEIIDYVGDEVTDDLTGRVSIEGWDAGDAAIELVRETFTPEISWNGEILHTAQVFCSRAAGGTDSENAEPAPMAEAVELPGDEGEVATVAAEFSGGEGTPEAGQETTLPEGITREFSGRKERLKKAWLSFLARVGVMDDKSEFLEMPISDVGAINEDEVNVGTKGV